MSKFKRILAIVLILSICPLSTFASTSTPDTITYDARRNAQTWSVENTNATTGTRYRTLAFKAKIEIYEGAKKTVYEANIKKMDDPEDDPDDIGGNKTVCHYMNFVSNTGTVPANADSFYKSFLREYGTKPEDMKKINNFFSKGGYMRLDSVGTVVVNGVARGEVDQNGNPKDDKYIYDNLTEFQKSAPWLPGTQSTAPLMFDIKIRFPPQPVIKPIPHITKGTGTTDVTSVEYKEGEIIDLVGINSEFPIGVKREYEWNYKKKGATTWTPCGKKATPDLTSLPIGEYEAKLDAQYKMKAYWAEGGEETVRSKAPATCTIKIKTNDEIFATATVASPADVEIESDATYANVPVTLKSNLVNLDGGKVKSVTYQLMTEEGSQVFSETFNGSETLSQSKSFKITYKGEPFTQGFKGQVTYVLESGRKIDSNEATSVTYIHKKGIGNLPPVPIISPIPNTVSGNDIRLNGASSYDPDGEVVSWDFSIPQWGYYYNEDGKKSTWKTTIGYGNRIQAVLGVTDDDGAYSETSTFFNVTPPPPILNISVGGSLKENRKVIFNSNVTNISGYTTTDSQVEWTVSSLDGQTTDKIKLKATVGKSIQGLFKEKGQYLVECKATNSANMTANQSIKVNISEDLLPTVVVDGYDTVYRNDEKQAEIKVFDNSYSIDNDYVATRYWYYAFDKDNDGSFDDETLTFLKSATLPEDNELTIPTNQVGKYKIYLRVQEGFGQETIPDFVTASDYKINSNYKIIEVQNYKPIVSFVPMKDKKVDVVVVTDYTGDKLTQLGTRLNEYVGESFENGINVKLQVATDSKYVGRYLPDKSYGWNKVTDSTAGKYVVSQWSTYTGNLIEYSDNSYEITASTRNCWLSDISKTTVGTFPARIKQTQTINYCTLILLENGDLYMLGTNSQYSRPYNSTNGFDLVPTKKMSNVVTIVQSTKLKTYNNYDIPPMLMYVLTDSGDVYAVGEVPHFYKYQGAFFTSVDADTHLNMASLFTTTSVDYTGYDKFSSNSYRTIVGTGKDLSKVKGLSNITYAKDTGSGLVARDIYGNWYGFGSALNAFGYNTGFTSLGLVAYGSEDEKSSPYGMYNTVHHFDEFNDIVKIQTLSDMDKAIGGISKIDVGKAYASNGDIYAFKQTPELYFGEEAASKPFSSSEIQGIKPGLRYEITYTYADMMGNSYYKVYYPFQLGEGTFAYSKVGTGYIDKEVRYDSGGLTASQVDSEYTYSEYYESLLSDYNIPLTGTTQFVESRYDDLGQWTTPPPSKVTKYYEAPVKLATGEINTFERFAYKVEHTLVSWTTSSHTVGSRRDKDDTTFYDRIGNYSYKITAYKKEIPTTDVAGWKFYGVDIAKLPSTTFRPNSEKYILYVGEKDSFQKIGTSILDFIKVNNIKVKVATNPKYVDRATTKSVEINLRDMITATPNGKLYPSDGLETMLADMTEENKVFTEAQDGLYVIKGEDTVTYTSYYNDIESDTKLNEVYNHLQNSTYFENSEGQSVYHNVKRAAPVSVFDKVGLYNVFYRATDQPSTDANFQNYNKDSNTDEMKVYVHRRPIAKMEVQYSNYAPFSLKAFDNTSYDLDHRAKRCYTRVRGIF